MHHVWGLAPPFNKMMVVLFTKCPFFRKSKFHRTLLPLSHSKPNGNSLRPNTSRVSHMLFKTWISNPAGQFMSLIQYHPCDGSYLSTERVTTFNRFPWTRCPRCQVQRELWGTIFSGIENLGVSCYNGNNDQAAWALFVKHSRAQGEWLRQNPSFARFFWSGFDCIIRPEPSGASQTTPALPRSLSPEQKNILSVSLCLFSSQVMLLEWSKHTKPLLELMLSYCQLDTQDHKFSEILVPILPYWFK